MPLDGTDGLPAMLLRSTWLASTRSRSDDAAPRVVGQRQNGGKKHAESDTSSCCECRLRPSRCGEQLSKNRRTPTPSRPPTTASEVRIPVLKQAKLRKVEARQGDENKELAA